MKMNFEAAKAFFMDAEQYVRENFPEDLEWSEAQVSKVNVNRVSKDHFMAEAAYVTYCSGYRQKIVEKYWPQLTELYCRFIPEMIAIHADEIEARATYYINHKGKIKAIINTAKFLANLTDDEWREYKKRITPEDNFEILTEFGYIGKITKYHLARNIGFDTIKPDRHLERIGKAVGIDPFQMCRKLSEQSKILVGKHYPVHTIDSIFWRTAAEEMIIYDDYPRLRATDKASIETSNQ